MPKGFLKVQYRYLDDPIETVRVLQCEPIWDEELQLLSLIQPGTFSKDITIIGLKVSGQEPNA